MSFTDEKTLPELAKCIDSAERDLPAKLSNIVSAREELASVLRLIAAAEHLVAMELKPERGDWEPLEKALAAIRKVQP